MSKHSEKLDQLYPHFHVSVAPSYEGSTTSNPTAMVVSWEHRVAVQLPGAIAVPFWLVECLAYQRSLEARLRDPWNEVRAVKLVRSALGIGLKEAVACLHALREDNRI